MLITAGLPHTFSVALVAFAAINLLSALAWYRFQMRMARRFGPEILDKTKDLHPPTIRNAFLLLPAARRGEAGPASTDGAAAALNGGDQPGHAEKP